MYAANRRPNPLKTAAGAGSQVNKRVRGNILSGDATVLDAHVKQ
jgi:hypothetical protein